MKGRTLAVMIGVAIGLQILSAIPVAAQVTPAVAMPPVEVSGRISCETTNDREGSVERVEIEGPSVLSRKRGWTWQQAATMSDPRLEGSHHISYDWDEYIPSNGAESVRVGSETWRIENDEGAWQGSFVDLSLTEGEWTIPLVVLDGEGDYEGLTAILRGSPVDGSCGLEVSGVIIAGEPPAAPQPHGSG